MRNQKWNRLEELIRSLDYNNLDPKTIEAVEELLVELGADGDGGAIGGKAAFDFDTGAHDQIHSLVFRLKGADTPAWERKTAIDEILKLVDEVRKARE